MNNSYAYSIMQYFMQIYFIDCQRYFGKKSNKVRRCKELF